MIKSLYRFLPPKLCGAIDSALRLWRDRALELHIVCGGSTSVRFSIGKAYLGINISGEDIEKILALMTGGALYAHRATLAEGFLTLEGGFRVGVCGQARYEGERLVGVSNVSSLLIRIPSEACSFSGELYDAFLRAERGMLIYAPAGGGKTTALRALIGEIAKAREIGRISVIDERLELSTKELMAKDIDLFRGYKRGEGVRIALRVMSPEVIAVDELGATVESEELIESLMSGVKFIATAHARSLEELKKRKNLTPFFEMGIFDVFVGIFNTDRGFWCKIHR